MRSGSCSSSIVSIFPLVLMLVPAGLNFGLEKASAFFKRKKGEKMISNFNFMDFFFSTYSKCVLLQQRAPRFHVVFVFFYDFLFDFFRLPVQTRYDCHA